MMGRAGRALPAPGPQLRRVAPPGTSTCPACQRRFVDGRWEAELQVCPRCGHHQRIGAWMRAVQLADVGALQPLHLPADDADPLGFDDGVPYRDRLRAARLSTGVEEAIVAARARIGGVAAMIASMEFAFLGGSLGRGAGEAFARTAETAVEEGRALVAVCTSGGARMQEGIVALAQMGRCTAAVAAVAAARLPYVSVLADPCFGGVTASFATQADVVLAEPGARIGFAGGRVIEQATHERLPEGFQTAEFLLAHGMVDAVVHRHQLRPVLQRLLNAYGSAAGRPNAA